MQRPFGENEFMEQDYSMHIFLSVDTFDNNEDHESILLNGLLTIFFIAFFGDNMVMEEGFM